MSVSFLRYYITSVYSVYLPWVTLSLCGFWIWDQDWTCELETPLNPTQRTSASPDWSKQEAAGPGCVGLTSRVSPEYSPAHIYAGKSKFRRAEMTSAKKSIFHEWLLCRFSSGSVDVVSLLFLMSQDMFLLDVFHEICFFLIIFIFEK